MKTIVPSYYKNFSCIAEKCKHSCCIGWEIDIDSDTCNYYSHLTSEFGDKLRKHIDLESNEPHFILTNNERCPFLNQHNLCDIIINLGDDKLCDICREHPRFRNFYSDRVEVGLGLCCEAAADLILNNKDIAEFIALTNEDEIATEKEKEFFALRDDILEIIQNRSLTIKCRVEKLINKYDVDFPPYSLAEWAEIFINLEQLDNEWTEKLHNLKNYKTASYNISETACEQLLVYFIYRHLEGALYDGRLKQRLAFAFLALYITNAISTAEGSDFTNIARCYSSEIEYSEENTERLLEIL